MRILIVEDETQLARHIHRALYRAGHESQAVHDGAEALALILDHPPDLVVLDLNLPGLDGIEVLTRMYAARSSSRVIILTARGDVASRVQGLKAGADDYLAKPFSMEELIARVEALGRRASLPTAADLLEIGELRMDIQQRRVTRGSQSISLSPREFDVLHVLMGEPGRIFSRTEICERVWQREHEYDMRTVDIVMSRLRKKIDSPFPTPLIQTSRALGYGIAAPGKS